ncbi:MAG: hypothetical protein J7K15_04355 [Deltaproteobacteria bacterium]|nr:hypothetical protein [Deltaproteobacteria bacterium]
MLKNHPELNEKWIQAKIAEDPSIIGLGELSLKDTERPQPSGGRLDLLLHDPESNRRYEVELQLGKSDESHIIRTIEYWDYQRKKFPQYEHCAVLIAEDITSRFLNIISLFNGIIPFVAIQMKALRVHDGLSLFFTTVIDELHLGTDEDDEQEIVDRKYWESRGTKESVKLVDNIFGIIETVAQGYSLKYNKHYIGLSKGGISQNFVSFVPRKKVMLLSVKHEQTEEIEQLISESDFDVLAYDRQWKQYRLRLTKKDIENSKDALVKLIGLAYAAYMS